MTIEHERAPQPSPDMNDLVKSASELTLTSPPLTACRRCLSIEDILDVIFSHHVSQEVGTAERGAIALVCRTWRTSAQRCLFQKINTCKIIKYEPLRSHLKFHVKELLFADPGTKSGWHEKELSRLLLSLPNLKVLNIELYKSYLMTADYRYLGKFEKVEVLSIESRHYNQGLDSYRQLIASCPNIHALTLKHAAQYHHHYHEPSESSSPKVELPNLISLSLKGIRLARDFLKLQLITPQTLNQITNLGISGVGTDPHLGPEFTLDDFMEQIGSNIISLTLGTFSSQGMARQMITSMIMSKCPNLITLKTYETIDVELLPLSLRNLKFMNDPQELLNIMRYRKNEGVSTWKDVKRVEFGMVSALSDEDSEWLKEEGIEVILGDPMNAFLSDSLE